MSKNLEQVRPLTPDELLAFDNRPAQESVPDNLTVATGTRSVILSSEYAPKDETVLLTQLRENDRNVWRPAAGVIQGLAGRSAERLPRASTAAVGAAMTEPFRPDWVDDVPHPKVSAVAPRLMRNRKGRLVRPHKVYGGEDRQVYLPSGYPWHCIGRVFIWKNAAAPVPSSSGTGVLIGPRHVLTARHLTPWGASSWKMLFVPAFFDGGSLAGVDSWTSDFRGFEDGLDDPDEQEWDFAVLRLYDPLGERLGWFGSRVYNDDWEGQNRWTLAGYPGDVAGAQRPSRQLGIAVIDDDPSGDAMEIEHRGDASDGNSGGPLFGIFEDGFPYAIGVHSGEEYREIFGVTAEDNNVAAGGLAMANLINAVRTNLP